MNVLYHFPSFPNADDLTRAEMASAARWTSSFPIFDAWDQSFRAAAAEDTGTVFPSFRTFRLKIVCACRDSFHVRKSLAAAGDLQCSCDGAGAFPGFRGC